MSAATLETLSEEAERLAASGYFSYLQGLLLAQNPTLMSTGEASNPGMTEATEIFQDGSNRMYKGTRLIIKTVLGIEPNEPFNPTKLYRFEDAEDQLTSVATTVYQIPRVRVVLNILEHPVGRIMPTPFLNKRTFKKIVRQRTDRITVRELADEYSIHPTFAQHDN